MRRVCIGRVATNAFRPHPFQGCQHLAEWERSLRAKRNTEKHVSLAVRRARQVLTGCGFTFVTEIADWRVVAFIDERDGGALAPQTKNFYLQAVKQFLRWMKLNRRISDNPLEGTKGWLAPTGTAEVSRDTG